MQCCREDHKYQQKAFCKTTLKPYILLPTEQHTGSIKEPLFRKELSRIEVSVILTKIKPPWVAQSGRGSSSKPENRIYIYFQIMFLPLSFCPALCQLEKTLPEYTQILPMKKKRSWNSKSTINKKGSGFCSGQSHPIQRVPTKAGICICEGTHQIKDNIWSTLLQVWILFLKEKKRIFLKFTSPRGTVSQCKCIGLPTVNMAHHAATTTKQFAC